MMEQEHRKSIPRDIRPGREWHYHSSTQSWRRTISLQPPRNLYSRICISNKSYILNTRLMPHYSLHLWIHVKSYYYPNLSLSFKTSTSSCVIPLFGSKYFISKFIPITIEMPCKHIKIQSFQVNDKQSILQPKYIDVTMFETCDSAGDENERREGVERGPSLALIHNWLLLFMVISMLRRRGKRRCTSLLWVDVRTEPHLAVGAKLYRCRANCHRVRQHLLRLSR